MKNLVCVFVFLLICTFSSYGADKKTVSKSLESGFITSPDSVQTSIYWYWISDHISVEGVANDLRAMKQAGINRAFIGNIGLSEGEAGRGKVKFQSEEWWKVLHSALKTATELGIDIGIFNSPGWSQSGGPWVKPQEAMRYLASTKTQVTGGQKVNVVLPRPEGPFKEHFQDVKVVAYPVIKGGGILTSQNTKVTTQSPLRNVNNILDGSMDSEIVFESSAENEKEAAIDFRSDAPFTLRGIKIYPKHSHIDCRAKIQVKEGTGYRTLAEFTISRVNAQLNVGFDPFAPAVISVPATTSQDFRLVVSRANSDSGLKEIELSSTPLVERYPEKTFAKMFQSPLPYWQEYQWPVQPVADESLVVNPAKVMDISKFLSGDQLSWNAPKGEWIVMRTGMYPTGVTNGPAGPDATGLEIDKMSRKHVETHFDAYMGEIYSRIPAKDRKSWKVVVQDSYETGGQNFTDDFLTEFKSRFKYDPLPYLPVYAGVVVGSEDLSDRFLWDMRRFVADKIAYDYVGGLRDKCHKYGLTTWLENYGHWGYPGEFLQYGGQSDEIGGEFWSEGSLGDIENRAASSCGHIYGKTKISAESFTAGGGGYHRYPAMMKQRGDRFFSEGINNTLLHLFISQPYEDREPGVNAPFSNEFNRKNTWYPHMDLFTSYLKRVNYMLQQGLNVADVAYFIGEDAPKMTGITDPELPKGYQFDYMNAEIIERNLTVKDGLLTLPHGTQYRILVLPKLETMRPELLAKIQKLIEAGAVVMGPAPKRSPSLENFPKADKEVDRRAKALWSKIDPNTKYAKIGKGMLIDGLDMKEALALIKCVPDCNLAQEDPVLYGHRSVNGMEIYFVSNQHDKPITFQPEFRVKGMEPEVWDPVSGSTRELPAYQQTETGTIVPIKLDVFESAFIVFRNKAEKSPATAADVLANYPAPQVMAELSHNWIVSFDKEKRGPEHSIAMDKLINLATSEQDAIKYYAGTVLYNNTFNISNQSSNDRYYINLNDLSAMAKVKINGVYAGGVWTAPYRVDITKQLVKGRNIVEIEVTTTWVNRLIGDLKLPENERKTWLTFQPWRATDSLHKSGLIGPVLIETIAK